MTEEKQHHLYGGSTAKYWANCYGWASLVSTLPPDNPGSAAEKGTALHTGVLERKTMQELRHLSKGTPVDVSYDDIPNWPLDGEEIANNFWNALWTNALEEFITHKQIYIEKKLMLFPDRDSGGTADIIILHYDDKAKLTAIVGDLKTGYYRVEPSDEQLLFYLAALYLRAQEKGKEIEVFKSFVYQPTHSEPYTEHKFTKKAVLKAVKRYEKAIRDSKKPNPKFKVGEWCQWCKAQAVCKTYRKHLEKEMDLAMRDGTLPEVEHIPDEALLKIFVQSEKIERYLSDVRKWIIQRFAIGKPVPGLKIVAGVAKRRWADEDHAISTLRDAGIEPTREKLIGILEAEKLLRKQGHSKDDVQLLMYNITDKPKPAPKITIEEDPRVAITLDTGSNLLLGLDDGEFD